LDLDDFLQNISGYTIPVLFAVTMREVAHGWTAKLFGDRTAELLGRLSLNPLKHLDLIGTVLVPGLLLTLPSVPVFGWARPVPVATGALKNPRIATLAVAAAGPLANILMALFWCAVLAIIVHVPHGRVGPRWISFMAQAGIRANIYVGYLNLLPIPPLDGGRALLGFLPNRLALAIQKIEPVGLLFALLILVTAASQQFGMSVVFKPAYTAVTSLVDLAIPSAVLKK
jgi:Zn-dependent protease